VYPHGRLLLASLTFSGALGALVALAGVVTGVLIWSEPLVDPLDDAPIRAVAALVTLGAPIVAVGSLVLSIPASYFQWGRPPFPFLRISLVCGSIAAIVIGSLLLPGSSLGSTFVIAFLFAILMAVSAWFWRLALPRSNKSLERTRER
jgi:hypothetical protein